MTTKPPIDWEKIELDYRAGLKSLREIADGSGVSHVTISKHAKRNGWVRDLAAKIQQKANELVNRAGINTPVNNASAVSERETIEANAEAIANVKLSHRHNIHQARNVAMAFLGELEQQAGGDAAAQMAKLGTLMRSEDEQGQDKLNDLYQKIISLPARAKTMKDLGESLRVLVTLERQAFGMDLTDKKPAGGGLESLVAGDE